MVPISQLPAEAEERAVRAHWAGHLILGQGGKSQIATIVEPTTQFTLLEARTVVAVRDAVAAEIVELLVQLRSSLTWDQGKGRSFSVPNEPDERPRQTLGWITRSEKFSGFVAMVASARGSKGLLAVAADLQLHERQ